ncbi:MAG: DNA-3-methyladenine glycosylase, partial [Alphaproteobacteria bacterium]
KTAKPDEFGARNGQKPRVRLGYNTPMSAGHIFNLSFLPPYPWPWLLSFLGARAIPGVEAVVDDCYRRSIVTIEGPAIIEVRLDPDSEALLVTSNNPLDCMEDRLRRQFDLHADPAVIDGQLGADPLLAPLVAARPGLRVPKAWDVFELAVRAIVGQQVSVAGATTVTGRIATRFGTPLAGADGPVNRLFPIPEQLAEADVATTGIPGKRARTINNFAAAVAKGDVVFDDFDGLEDMVENLSALPGIGPWTANYIAMRGLGLADAFPVGDLGLVRAFDARGKTLSHAELTARAEAWRPWRAYATMHLWASASAGG